MISVVEGKVPFVIDERFTLNQALLHQVVVAKAAQLRSDTARQKNRSAVRGGGRKPWRQKGTGRARAGTTRGPLWRGGGVTFANTGRNYNKKVNKKMYHAAMKQSLLFMQSSGALCVVEDFVLAEISTRQAHAFIAPLLQAKKRLLIVVEQLEEKTCLSLRNIPYVALVDVASLGVLDLVYCDSIVLTQSACTHLSTKYTI